MSREDRRNAIVEAAVRLVLERGLAAATVRGVAASLACSPGQIHHHFASADDLRAEAFREGWRRMGTAIVDAQRDRGPRERLLGLLVGTCDEHSASASRLWKDALAAARMSAVVRLAVREALADWRTAIVEVLADGKASGVFPPALDEQAVATRLMVLALGLDVWADVGLDGAAASGSSIVTAALTAELAAASPGR